MFYWIVGKIINDNDIYFVQDRHFKDNHERFEYRQGQLEYERARFSLTGTNVYLAVS